MLRIYNLLYNFSLTAVFILNNKSRANNRSDKSGQNPNLDHLAKMAQIWPDLLSLGLKK